MTSKSELKTVSGASLTATIAYRVPLPLYQELLAEAQRRNVKLSKMMRDIVEVGLKAIKESSE